MCATKICASVINRSTTSTQQLFHTKHTSKTDKTYAYCKSTASRGAWTSKYYLTSSRETHNIQYINHTGVTRQHPAESRQTSHPKQPQRHPTHQHYPKLFIYAQCGRMMIFVKSF